MDQSDNSIYNKYVLYSNAGDDCMYFIESLIHELHQDQFNIDDRNINEQWIDFLDHLKYEGIY